MNHNFFYSLILITFLIFFTGCNDPTVLEPTPVAAVTQSSTGTSSPPTIPPATAMAEPSPTPEPTLTPTLPPTATERPAETATAIPPTEAAAGATTSKEGAFLEWVLPQPATSRVSVSGGSIEGYELVDEYAAVIAGESIAIVNMGISPIAQEIGRIPLPGVPSSHARSGRFWFLKIKDFASIIDLADPLNVTEVARINNLGVGELILGDDGQVYFLDKEAQDWWALDVDQVLPAMRADKTPVEAIQTVDEQTFIETIHRPNFLDLREQIKVLTTDHPNWIPENVMKIGEDFVYLERSGDTGGGFIVRLDVQSAELPTVKSVYRSFYPRTIEVEGQMLYSVFAYEGAGQADIIDVNNPAEPRFAQTFENRSNAVRVINNTLLSGARPGLVVFDLENQVDRLVEVPIFNERSPFPFLVQLEISDDQQTLFGLTGIYFERGGVAVYSIEDPTNPTAISFIEFSEPYGPIEIKYAAGRLYGYRTEQNGTSTVFVYDVTDPVNPQEILRWSTEERVIGLQPWQDGSGRHVMAALTADEISIWDMTDLNNDLQQLSKLFAPPACVVEDSRIAFRPTILAEDWLFAPLGNCPTNRIDISDPENPIILETLDSNGPMIFEDGLLYMGGRNLRIYKFD